MRHPHLHDSTHNPKGHPTARLKPRIILGRKDALHERRDTSLGPEQITTREGCVHKGAVGTIIITGHSLEGGKASLRNTRKWAALVPNLRRIPHLQPPHDTFNILSLSLYTPRWTNTARYNHPSSRRLIFGIHGIFFPRRRSPINSILDKTTNKNIRDLKTIQRFNSIKAEELDENDNSVRQDHQVQLPRWWKILRNLTLFVAVYLSFHQARHLRQHPTDLSGIRMDYRELIKYIYERYLPPALKKRQKVNIQENLHDYHAPHIYFRRLASQQE